MVQSSLTPLVCGYSVVRTKSSHPGTRNGDGNYKNDDDDHDDNDDDGGGGIGGGDDVQRLLDPG